MKYAGFSRLFIIYIIIKGTRDQDGFKKIKSLADFGTKNDFMPTISRAIFLKRIIEDYKLDVNFVFDEETFMEAINADYLPPNGTKVLYTSLDEKMVVYSCLDEQIERTILNNSSIINDFYDEENDEIIEGSEYYKNYFAEKISKVRNEITNELFFGLVDDASRCDNKSLKQCFNAVLACIRFDIYGKDNIVKLTKFLDEYLTSFVNDNLELEEEKNFYNYRNNREFLITILKDSYIKYGNSFSISSQSSFILSTFKFSISSNRSSKSIMFSSTSKLK